MGDYIMDMRKRVGHIPLMQCGASVIVENERGEILLQQRSDNGAWGYPGGDQVSNVDIVFVCREWQGELVCQPGEVEALAFFAPEALPSPLHEIDHPALKAWMQLREAREQK